MSPRIERNSVMNGLSFYICFGQKGRTGFYKDGPSIRLTILWMSICIMWIDLECAIGGNNRYIKKLEAKIEFLQEI